MYSPKYLKNLPFGLFCGATTTLALCAAFDSDISEDLTRLYSFVFSGLIALFAASVALSGVLANLRQQEVQRAQERSRKLLAAKALLPIALSEMCEVAKRGMINSWRDQPNAAFESRAEFDRQSLEDIRLSDGIISAFREVVQFDDDDDAAHRIQGVLREYQVFHARWRSHINDRNNINQPNLRDIAERTVAWAFLYALTSTAFDYSRGEADRIEEVVDEQAISSALSMANCPTDGLREFADAIGLYSRHFIRRFGP